MKRDKAEKIISQPRMDDLKAKDTKSMVPWCTPIFESPSTLVHYALIETPQKSWQNHIHHLNITKHLV